MANKKVEPVAVRCDYCLKPITPRKRLRGCYGEELCEVCRKLKAAWLMEWQQIGRGIEMLTREVR